MVMIDTDKLSILKSLLSDKNVYPYKGAKITIRLEYYNDTLYIKICNSYHFKDFLKNAGFIYTDYAWIGEIENLNNLDNNVFKRMFQAVRYEERKMLYDLFYEILLYESI